jgi:hypothetical protein
MRERRMSEKRMSSGIDSPRCTSSSQRALTSMSFDTSPDGWHVRLPRSLIEKYPPPQLRMR